MPLLFLGFVFVFVSLMWLVWTITLLFWPVALLIAGCVVLRGQMRHWRGFASGRGAFPIGDRWARPNHNTAFADYREATLRNFDEERGEFHDFVGRLRKSRDKVEFDRFIAERRARLDGPMPGQSPAI
jgi:hypothetical protein